MQVHLSQLSSLDKMTLVIHILDIQYYTPGSW